MLLTPELLEPPEGLLKVESAGKSGVRPVNLLPVLADAPGLGTLRTNERAQDWNEKIPIPLHQKNSAL